MTQRQLLRQTVGKEWSTPCPAVGMKGMRETAVGDQGAGKWREVAERGTESFRGSGRLGAREYENEISGMVLVS